MKKWVFSPLLLVAVVWLLRPVAIGARQSTAYRLYIPLALKEYPPPPSPVLSALPAGSSAVLGEALRMKFSALNAVSPVPGNTAAGRGYDNTLVVSFPSLTGVMDGVRIVIAASDFETATVEMVGGYWRVTASNAAWDAGQSYSLTVDVQPVSQGDFQVLAKVVMHSRSTADLPYTDPWSGETVTEADVRLVSPPVGASGTDADGEAATLVQYAVGVGGMWERVQSYRQAAGVSALTLDTSFTSDCQAHAAYMSTNDVVTHAEDSNLPGYTAGGYAAGQAGALAGFEYGGDAYQEIWAADALMANPFTALQVLNPWLRWSGAGTSADGSGAVRQAGCLDIARGVDYLASPQYPVVWPPDGGSTPLLTYRGGAYPDPLAPCGYPTPAGAPIVFSLGDGGLTPVVSSSSLRVNGVSVPYCLYTEATYTSPDAAEQQAGRDILNAFDAVVLVPQYPLDPGQSYVATIVVAGHTYTTHFTAGEAYSAYPVATVR